MSKEDYRKMKENSRVYAESNQSTLAKAINHPTGVFAGSYGRTMWKNPVTKKLEPYDPVKICGQYGLSLTIQAKTEAEQGNDPKLRAHRARILQQKRENQERIDNSRSSFVFLIWDGQLYAEHTNIAPDIAPETLTRLTLLAGFLKWESQYIMRSNDVTDPDRKLCSKRARKRDIRNMLRLNPATFARFWTDATGNGYLTGDDENGYQLSPIFYRGRLKGTYAQRIYTEQFRNWYYDGCENEEDPVDTRNHRRMGKVISLIPYVNMEHNVLCFDRAETRNSSIKPLSGIDIARRLGSESGNWKRDLGDLKKLTIRVNGVEQYVFAQNTDRSALCLGYYLNPNLFYYGKKDYFELLSEKPFFTTGRKVP